MANIVSSGTTGDGIAPENDSTAAPNGAPANTAAVNGSAERPDRLGARYPGTPNVREILSRKNFLIFAAVLSVLLTVYNLQVILRQTPEYDEIWTVQHFVNLSVPAIFTDVSVPNNHILNTLGIKLFSGLIPNRNLAMRFSSLLGFCGLCLILLRCCLLHLKTNAARGAVLAFVLLDGIILHYAETARGYSLQTFFVFGLFLSLLCTAPGRDENRRFNAVMWFLCATGCSLSISTGVLFTVILTGLWVLLFVPFREGIPAVWRQYRPLILAGILWSLLATAWYGANLTRLAQGRADFGETFHSAGQYLAYCLDALLKTRLGLALPFLAAGAVLCRERTSRRICILCGGAVLLMLLAILLTKGGPPRIFLPLVPPAFFGVGVVLDGLFLAGQKKKWLGFGVFLLVFTVCVVSAESRRKDAADPDLAPVFREVLGMDARIFAAYRPTDLYVLKMLFNDALLADDAARQEAEPEMLLLVHDNYLSTVRINESEIHTILPGASPVSSDLVVPGERVRYWLYRLRPVAPGESLKGKAVLGFASLPLSDDATDWMTERFAALNAMLIREASRICFAASGDGQRADDLLKLEEAESGHLRFRVVSD